MNLFIDESIGNSYDPSEIIHCFLMFYVNSSLGKDIQ